MSLPKKTGKSYSGILFLRLPCVYTYFKIKKKKKESSSRGILRNAPHPAESVLHLNRDSTTCPNTALGAFRAALCIVQDRTMHVCSLLSPHILSLNTQSPTTSTLPSHSSAPRPFMLPPDLRRAKANEQARGPVA